MIKKYEEFKRVLQTVISNSELDPGAVYYVFKDVYKEIEGLYYRELQKELAEAQSAENKDEESGKED